MKEENQYVKQKKSLDNGTQEQLVVLLEEPQIRCISLLDESQKIKEKTQINIIKVLIKLLTHLQKLQEVLQLKEAMLNQRLEALLI